MTDNDEVFFDTKSGISIEEQQEILSAINKITEKNRPLLSQNNGKQWENFINAKKNGTFFPLAVNIAAVVILFVGALLLIFFNRRYDSQVRTGSAVYNLTERALIEEIRRDTAERIAAKEMEISSIASRLREVDEQLLRLRSSNQVLTSEQLATQEELVFMQLSYRDELGVLQNERAQILEDSRAREARLRAQLEERAREYAAVQQRTSGELDAARDELERLTVEQEGIAAIDAQLAGGLISVSALVQNGQFDQAIEAVESLRHFNNNNSYSSVRSFQTRREIYNQSLNSMETVINELRKSGVNVNAEGTSAVEELHERNVQLEETIAQMQRTLDAFSSGSSGREIRIAELEETVSSLETSTAEKDRTIFSLETERTSLVQTVNDLRSVNTAQEQEITNLRNQIEIIRQLLAE